MISISDSNRFNQTKQRTMTTKPELNKEQRDLLFISLNLVLHTKMNKLGTSYQHTMISLYKELTKVYPSGFHTSKDLEDFLEA